MDPLTTQPSLGLLELSLVSSGGFRSRSAAFCPPDIGGNLRDRSRRVEEWEEAWSGDVPQTSLEGANGSSPKGVWLVKRRVVLLWMSKAPVFGEEPCFSVTLRCGWFILFVREWLVSESSMTSFHSASYLPVFSERTTCEPLRGSEFVQQT